SLSSASAASPSAATSTSNPSARKARAKTRRRSSSSSARSSRVGLDASDPDAPSPTPFALISMRRGSIRRAHSVLEGARGWRACRRPSGFWRRPGGGLGLDGRPAHDPLVPLPRLHPAVLVAEPVDQRQLVHLEIRGEPLVELLHGHVGV